MSRIGNTPPYLILTCTIEEARLVTSQPKMVKENRNPDQNPSKKLRTENGGIRLIQNDGTSLINASQMIPSKFRNK